MLTSKPMLGLLVAEIGHAWGMFTIILELPKYLDVVLHLPVAQVTQLWGRGLRGKVIKHYL